MTLPIAVLQLPEEDELLWDDGSAYPEYCLDRFELVSKVRCPRSGPAASVKDSCFGSCPLASKVEGVHRVLSGV